MFISNIKNINKLGIIKKKKFTKSLLSTACNVNSMVYITKYTFFLKERYVSYITVCNIAKFENSFFDFCLPAGPLCILVNIFRKIPNCLNHFSQIPMLNIKKLNAAFKSFKSKNMKNEVKKHDK